MATIHVSTAEAEADFKELIARARGGDEILIEELSGPTVVLRSAEGQPVRKLSEIIRILEERGSNATLDGEFAKYLLAVIESHQEPLIDPNNDPWA